MAISLFAIALLSAFPAIVNGFSFNLTSIPKQCQNLSIAITGSGTPPYSAVIVPYGPTPLPNNIEVREVVYQSFVGDSTTLSVIIPWPENSQFVVVVSDATGFGTGGTSAAATIQAGSDCFNPAVESNPPWTFDIPPNEKLSQCFKARIAWYPPQSVPQGNPQFYGVIPGGQSFAIKQEQAPYVLADQGTGFNWTVTSRAGTEIVVVGGDNRGIGSAGWASAQVDTGVSPPNNTCINNSSPSSTPGSPAGASYPTSTNSVATPTPTSTPLPHRSETGAIVGGVVGGVAGIAALILILLACLRRKRRQEERTDLLRGEEDVGRSNSGYPGDLPQNYQVEPFVGPDPRYQFSSYGYGSESDTRGSIRTSTGTDLLQSGIRDSFTHGAMSASGGSSSKNPSGPIYLRPVNFIEHEDAGPEEVPETVELPPSYANIRRKLTSGRHPPMHHASYTSSSSNAAAEASGTT